MSDIEKKTKNPEIAKYKERHKPKGLSEDQLTRWYSEIQGDPKLRKCSDKSKLDALFAAAEMGLSPGQYGGANILPYYNKDKNQYEAEFQPNYKGLLEVALRSEHLVSASADVVREDDEFDYWRENGKSHYKHKPSLQGGGEIIAAYADFKIKGGERETELFTKDDIENVKKAARQGGKLSPAWRNFEGEMVKKSVLRRGLKKMPTPSKLDSLLEKEDRQYNIGADSVETENGGGGGAKSIVNRSNDFSSSSEPDEGESMDAEYEELEDDTDQGPSESMGDMMSERQSGDGHAEPRDKYEDELQDALRDASVNAISKHVQDAAAISIDGRSWEQSDQRLKEKAHSRLVNSGDIESAVTTVFELAIRDICKHNKIDHSDFFSSRDVDLDSVEELQEEFVEIVSRGHAEAFYGG